MRLRDVKKEEPQDAPSVFNVFESCPARTQHSDPTSAITTTARIVGAPRVFHLREAALKQHQPLDEVGDPPEWVALAFD
jgi:hypothetical protein